MVSDFSLLFRLLQGVVGLLIIPLVISFRARMVLGRNGGGSLGYFLASQFLSPLAVILISILLFDFRLPDNTISLILVSQLIIFIIHEIHLVNRKKEIGELARRFAEKQNQEEEAKRKREEILTKWMK